jgi:hypothetical protein
VKFLGAIAGRIPPDIDQGLRYRLQALTKKVVETEQAIASGRWVAPPLVNGWVNYGAFGLATAAYYKDALGIVHLRGTIKDGTIGQAAFTLPAGCRPAADVVFAVNSNGAYGAAHVTAAGAVVPAVGATAQFMLDGVSFRGEA